MNASNIKILVIVPAFNEAGNIARTITDIKKVNLKIDIVVIDDGSKDATFLEVIKTNTKVISLPFNLGIGGAVQTGFKYADLNGYDIAVQMDGDGQHDAAYLTKLLEPIIEGTADMSIGSRFIEPNGGFRSSFVRRIGIRFFDYLINSLTGLKVTDPTSGFRAHNKKLISVFSNYYPTDFPEPEAIVVAKKAGFRIVESSVVMRKREDGQSSIGKLKSIYYMIKVTFAICLHMIRSE